MLYLILSPSCISQMELTYLINCSPDFFGEQPHDKHWATYEINGESVDGEHGHFGTVRVHDDYWHIDDEDRAFYNFDIRNSMELTKSQFDGLLHFIPKYNNIALLLHAQNVEDIWSWSQGHDIRVVCAFMGVWANDLEYWAMREFNDVMTDDANANYSEYEHQMFGYQHVLDSFKHRQQADNEWWKLSINHSHHYIAQEEWQRLEYIPFVYGKLQIKKPKARWINDYFINFQNHQKYNVENLTTLRNLHAGSE